MVEKLAKDVPVIVKTIEYLREKKPGRLTAEDISKYLKEDRCEVERALTALSKRKVIQEEVVGETRFYKFEHTSKAELAYKRLTDVYSKVARSERSELIVAGLLSDSEPLYSPSLFKALMSDGYKDEEVRDLIKRLGEEGKIRITKRPVFKGKKKKNGQEEISVDIKAVYAKEKMRFGLARKATADYKKRGYDGKVYSEEFLIGKFPKNVSDFARKYLEREGKSVIERVDKERPLRYGGKD